jgi:hypothetical protein
MNLGNKPLLHYRLEAANVKNMLKGGPKLWNTRRERPYFQD